MEVGIDPSESCGLLRMRPPLHRLINQPCVPRIEDRGSRLRTFCGRPWGLPHATEESLRESYAILRRASIVFTNRHLLLEARTIVFF